MFDDDEISLPWPEIPIDQLQLWLKVRQGEPVKYMLAPIGKFPMLSTHKAVPGDLAFEWAEIPMEKLAQDLGVNDGDLVLYGLISAKTVAVLKEDGASLEAAAESVKDLFGKE